MTQIVRSKVIAGHQEVVRVKLLFASLPACLRPVFVRPDGFCSEPNFRIRQAGDVSRASQSETVNDYARSLLPVLRAIRNEGTIAFRTRSPSGRYRRRGAHDGMSRLWPLWSPARRSSKSFDKDAAAALHPSFIDGKVFRADPRRDPPSVSRLVGSQRKKMRGCYGPGTRMIGEASCRRALALRLPSRCRYTSNASITR